MHTPISIDNPSTVGPIMGQDGQVFRSQNIYKHFERVFFFYGCSKCYRSHNFSPMIDFSLNPITILVIIERGRRGGWAVSKQNTD